MKKIIGIALCLAVLLAFSSCKKTDDNMSSAPVNADKVVSQESSTDESSSEDTGSQDTVTSDESSVNPTTSSEAAKPESSKNSSVPTSSVAPPVQSEVQTPPPVVSQEITSSVEDKIEEELPDVVGGDKEGSDLVLGEDYGAYLYEGTFVNLVTDKNIVYSIFKLPNTIVAYDTENLELIYSMPLPGRPAEIQVDGNNLLISYPDLKCIRVYNKKTLTQSKSISLPNVVSSFCIDGDIIYYSEDDQHCKVYRTDLSTNETKTIVRPDNVPELFYFPKLLLNKEKGLLYIGDSGTTGSTLYYYNTADLSLHSMFRKNDYGLTNQKRTMFYVNDNIFWGGFRFGSDSAKNIIGEYGGSSTHYADESFVITANGIYETDTYQYLGDTQSSIHMAVAENKCLIAVYQHNPGNVVVAVPY